ALGGVEAGRDVVCDDPFDFAFDDRAEDQDRCGDARLAQLDRLAAVADAERERSLFENLSRSRNGAVAVSVRLDDDDDLAVLADPLADRPKVGANGGEIDLGPDAEVSRHETTSLPGRAASRPSRRSSPSFVKAPRRGSLGFAPAYRPVKPA